MRAWFLITSSTLLPSSPLLATALVCGPISSSTTPIHPLHNFFPINLAPCPPAASLTKPARRSQAVQAAAPQPTRSRISPCPRRCSSLSCLQRCAWALYTYSCRPTFLPIRPPPTITTYLPPSSSCSPPASHLLHVLLALCAPYRKHRSTSFFHGTVLAPLPRPCLSDRRIGARPRGSLTRYLH